MNDISVAPLQMDDIPLVQRFIHENWRKGHPIAVDKELFTWQYHGYGRARGFKAFQVAKNEKEIVGFRAVIPLEIQLPYKDDFKSVTCYASAMWMIHTDYRGKGIGYQMHNNTEKIGGSSLAIGANKKTSVPIYRRGGYHELTSLNRYVLPLSKEHSALYVSNPKESNEDCYSNERSQLTKLTDTGILEKIWRQTSKTIFALNRTSEYWKWRYLDSPVFKYDIWGSEFEGIVVSRIEEVISKETMKPNGLKTLRIVEAIPANASFWDGEADIPFSQLIENVCAWGKEQGCCLADFFCSNNVYDKTMSEIGFYKQSEDFLPDERSHVALFQPLEKSLWTFNLYLRIDKDEMSDEFNFDRSYFVRSDTDQDRPNLIL